MKFQTLPVLITLAALATPCLGCDEFDGEDQMHGEGDELLVDDELGYEDAEARPEPAQPAHTDSALGIDSGTETTPVVGGAYEVAIGQNTNRIIRGDGHRAYHHYSIAADSGTTYWEESFTPVAYEVCNGSIIERTATVSFYETLEFTGLLHTETLTLAPFSCSGQDFFFRMGGGSNARRMRVEWESLSAATPTEEFCSYYLNETISLRETGNGRYLREFGGDTKANGNPPGQSEYKVGCVQRDGQWRATFRNTSTNHYMRAAGSTGVGTSGGLYGSGKWEIRERPNGEWALVSEHARYLGIESDDVSVIGDWGVSQTDTVSNQTTFTVVVREES